MSTEIILVVVMLIFSAFFSGMEIAFVSANKVFIEIEKKQENFISKIFSRLTEKPSKFIATMLIGNNIALVVYGFVMGDLLMHWFQTLVSLEKPWLTYMVVDLNLLTQTVLSTLVILLTAEFLPKVLFQIYANSYLKLFAVPAYFFYLIFTWVSDFVIWLSDFILKVVFKTTADQEDLVLTRDELGHYISEQMETFEEDDDIDSEIQIFQNALEFPSLKAREVMVPRTEILAVDYQESISNLSNLFTETGFSKVLVYKDSIDEILGYVHSFEMYKNPKTIKQATKAVEFVPESMFIKDVMRFLIKKRKSVAVVIDEYGGTSGILTVEDIVEELFGEIEDEHDHIETKEEVISDTEFNFSARLEVDYLNEHYKLQLPDSEHYETLGGLIVSITADIPSVGEVIEIQNYSFEILEVSSTKIDLVKIVVSS